MKQIWTDLFHQLPPPVQDLVLMVAPFAQIILITVVALVLRQVVRQLIKRAGHHYALPLEVLVGARRLASFLILSIACLMILERLGVSATTLWTAFTGFAAVAAVAFFAAWSVLSNIFCSILLYGTRLFRLHDHIELLENGEKPGLKGRVVDINLIYTTLEETGTSTQGTELKIPNALFFQRAVRRWNGPLGENSAVPPKAYNSPPDPDSVTAPASAPTPVQATAPASQTANPSPAPAVS